MIKSTQNLIFITLGFLFVVTGIIGIFLPLLPTTPFILLAAYFFSKGSKKCHDWLISNRILGEIILSWEKDRSISLRTKITGVSMICLFFTFSMVYLPMPVYAKIILVLTGIVLCTFLLTRKTKQATVVSLADDPQ